MAKILHEFLSCSYRESYFQEFSIHFKMWYSVYWYNQTHISHYMYLLYIKSPKTLNLERHKFAVLFYSRIQATFEYDNLQTLIILIIFSFIDHSFAKNYRVLVHLKYRIALLSFRNTHGQIFIDKIEL